MVLLTFCQQPGPFHGFWCCLGTRVLNLPPPELRTFLLPGVIQALLSATWVGLASPPPVKGSGHKHACKPGQAMGRSWDIHQDLRAVRAAWPAVGSSLHSQLLTPSASHPSCLHPQPWEHRDAGCSSSAFPLLSPVCCIPGDGSHGPISQNFFTFLPQNSCLALLFPSSLHLPTPQHQAQVLATPHIPVLLPPLSQEHTQLQATAASVFPI